MIPPPPQNGDEVTVADVLLRQGVFVLAPAKRRATAAALEAAGITATNIADVAAFLELNEPDEIKRRRYLASVVVDVTSCKESIASLAEFRKQGKGTERAAFGTHTRSVPVPYWTCECSECVFARMSGKPDQGPRPNYTLDGVCERPQGWIGDSQTPVEQLPSTAWFRELRQRRARA